MKFSIQMAYLIPCVCFLVPGVAMLTICSDLTWADLELKSLQIGNITTAGSRKDTHGTR